MNFILVGKDKENEESGKNEGLWWAGQKLIMSDFPNQAALLPGLPGCCPKITDVIWIRELAVQISCFGNSFNCLIREGFARVMDEIDSGFKIQITNYTLVQRNIEWCWTKS